MIGVLVRAVLPGTEMPEYDTDGAMPAGGAVALIGGSPWAKMT